MVENKESEKAFERYKEIIGFLNAEEDKQGIKLVDELIKKALNYLNNLSRIRTLETIEVFRRDLDRQSYNAELENLDRVRKISHDALISQVKIVNRYLFKNYKKDTPIGGIYSANPENLANENRTAIADWVKHLVDGLYRRGILKK